MDKKKIISSLTLAGMLATSVAGSGVFAAETSDPATKALGEYSKLITGKVAVPFILQSEADRVTGKDVKVAFPGKTVTIADDAVLKTGDVVNVNGEPRTIVIYGDTNCDGKINIMDAVTTLNHVKGKATLTGAAFAAADLNNNGDINILEAVGALNVVKGKAEYGNIATAPKAEVSKVTNKEITANNTIKLKFDLDASKYTYAIRDNKAETDVTISKVEYNANKKEATLTTATALTEAKDQTYTLTIKDVDGNVVSKDTFKYVALAEITGAKVEGDFDAINANNQNALSYKVSISDSNNEATTVIVTLKDGTGKEVTGTATLAPNADAVSVNNFSGVSDLKDGKLFATIKIIDEYGNTKSGTDTVNKDTKALVIANIETPRSGNTVKATVTMKDGAKADSLYFIVKKASESAPTASEVVAGNKTFTSGNQLSDVKLTEDVEYTIYVVAENANGVRSEMVSANIAKANAVQLKTVGTPTVNQNVAGEFTWTDDNNDATKVKGYKAILYTSDDKAIAVKETSEKKVNFLQEIKEYAQEYKEEYAKANEDISEYTIKVIAVGANSEIANSGVSNSSNVYKIKSVATTGNVKLKFDTDNTNHQILTWDIRQEASFYNVNIYKFYEVDGAVVLAESPIKTIPVDKGTAKCDLTAAMKDLDEGKYEVRVTCLAPSDSLKIDSIEVPADKPMYNVKAPTDLTLSLKNSKTVTASLTAISSILTSDVEHIAYELHYGFKLDNGKVMYDKDSNGGTTGSDKCVPKRLNKEGSLFNADINVIPEKTYGMYVSVLFNDTEIARTDAKEITIAKAPIEVRGLTVAEWNGVATIGADKIAYSGDKLNIGGNVYTSNDVASNYSDILKVVKVLNPGDVITQDEKGQISVTKTTNVSKDYADALKDVDFTIKGTSATPVKDITISGSFKSVTMGEYANNIKFSNVGKVVMTQENTSVTVSKDTKVIVPARTVTINGITVNTTAETEIKATETGLSIPGSNNTVEITAIDYATIEFTSSQYGDVTLTENNANKTLSVSGKLANVNIKKGNVNISGVTEYSQIHVEKGGNIIISGGSKKVNFAGIPEDFKIVPGEGGVTFTYSGDTGLKINGRASVEFKTNDSTESTISDLATNDTKVFNLSTNRSITLKVNQGSLTNGKIQKSGNKYVAKFDLSGEFTLSEKIINVANGATVSTGIGANVTIPATATVTVNGVGITTSGATDITATATATGLSIDGRSSAVKVTANNGETIAFTGDQTGRVEITNNGNKIVSVTGSGLTDLDIKAGTVDISDANVSNGKIYAEVGASIKTNKDKEIKYYADNTLISTINIKNIASESVIATHHGAGVVKLSGNATVTFMTTNKNVQTQTVLSGVGDEVDIPLVDGVQLKLTNDTETVSWARDNSGLVTIVNTGDLTIKKMITE